MSCVVILAWCLAVSSVVDLLVVNISQSRVIACRILYSGDSSITVSSSGYTGLAAAVHCTHS